jgi:hypothetical protein
MAEVEKARRLTADERKDKARILRALKSSKFVPKDAAVALGMSYSTVRRRIEAYALSPIVEKHNRRLRRRRENAELPPAPHEPSRQAQDQREHREAGLCSCGRRPAPRRNGSPGRMCETCRVKARDRKRGAVEPSTARV